LKNRNLTIPILLLAFSLSLVSVPSVVGLSPNTLYISPPTRSNQTTGSSLTYQVAVFQFDPFNTWDIMVATNPSVINPVSFTITPNTLTGNFSVSLLELTHCVNGVGNGCNLAGGDGPGVVHSAVLPLGAPPAGSVINGILFTITYTVTDPTGTSTTAGTGSSAVTIFNDLVANAGVPVTHTTMPGSYGPIVGQDFSVSANPTTPTIAAPPGGTVLSVITVSPIGGFNGNVNLTADVNPPGSGVTVSLDTSQITGGSGTTNLNIVAASNATAGPYTITVTGAGIISNLLTTRSAVVTLTVSTTVADYSIAISPNPVPPIEASYSQTVSVTVASINGFAGTVGLTAATLVNAPNVPQATFSSNSVTLAAGQSMSVSMMIQTFALTQVPAPTPSGLYGILVTGTSGTLVHTALGVVTVTPAVFLRQLHWIHHFDYSKNLGVQSFTAEVQNNATTAVVAQVVVLVRCGSFRAFARSDPAGTTLPGGNVAQNIAGPIVKVSFTLPLPATTIGDECTVRGALFYGGSSDPTTLTKVIVRKNTFTTNIVSPLIGVNGKTKTGPSKSLALQFEQTLTGKFFVKP
jgi:hypothetical protein